MTVYQDKRTGSWCYRFKKDNILYHRCFKDATRDDVVQFEIVAKSELIKSKYDIASENKFYALREIMDDYENYIRNAYSREDNIESAIRVINRLFNLIGNKQTSLITVSDIERYRTSRKNVVKNSSINREIDYIKKMFSLALDNKKIKENPDALNFWIDFLDASTGGESELDQYAIWTIGNRPKVVNDTNVKSIYYRNVPNLIFTTDIYNEFKEKTGYVFMQLSEDMSLNYFNISAQGKSAKDALDELLYQHSYCTESISISAIPIYYLEPNTRISVYDELSKINGEYVVNRISIPLTYNGQMSIQATKAPSRFN